MWRNFSAVEPFCGKSHRYLQQSCVLYNVVISQCSWSYFSRNGGKREMKKGNDKRKREAKESSIKMQECEGRNYGRDIFLSRPWRRKCSFLVQLDFSSLSKCRSVDTFASVSPNLCLYGCRFYVSVVCCFWSRNHIFMLSKLILLIYKTNMK